MRDPQRGEHDHAPWRGGPPWAHDHRGHDDHGRHHHGPRHRPTPAQWRWMRRRLLIALGLVGAVLAGGGFLVGRLLASDRLTSTLGGVAVLVVALLVLGRLTWRWARPVSGVVAAVDRVAEGELDTRAPTEGPRAVRRLATSFNTMAERLERDDERRRRLLADVAHELRTPLTVVRGTVEGIVDGLYAPDAARLGRVLGELHRVERLLDDLRTLSNADAGVLRLEREEVALEPLAARVAALHRPRATAAGISLVVTADAMPTVEADRARLEQVLTNLVDNALRHADGATRIEIGIGDDGAEALLAVTDDGIGLPADVRDDPFERAPRTADTSGTGLGLPIVRRLVAHHGGSVRVGEAADGGTRIEVRLPLSA